MQLLQVEGGRMINDRLLAAGLLAAGLAMAYLAALISVSVITMVLSGGANERKAQFPTLTLETTSTDPKVGNVKTCEPTIP
jgi:hypothetical protein